MAHYPRGGKQLKEPFKQFDAQATVRWFERRGVALKTEPDGRTSRTDCTCPSGASTISTVAAPWSPTTAAFIG